MLLINKYTTLPFPSKNITVRLLNLELKPFKSPYITKSQESCNILYILHVSGIVNIYQTVTNEYNLYVQKKGAYMYAIRKGILNCS